MRYYKEVKDEYIIDVGTGLGFTEITESEYNEIMLIIKSCPTPPTGFDYFLRIDLTWELIELPPEPVDPKIDDSEALKILLGGDINE